MFAIWQEISWNTFPFLNELITFEWNWSTVCYQFWVDNMSRVPWRLETPTHPLYHPTPHVYQPCVRMWVSGPCICRPFVFLLFYLMIENRKMVTKQPFPFFLIHKQKRKIEIRSVIHIFGFFYIPKYENNETQKNSISCIYRALVFEFFI